MRLAGADERDQGRPRPVPAADVGPARRREDGRPRPARGPSARGCRSCPAAPCASRCSCRDARAPLVDLSALAEKSRERFEELAARFARGARKAGPPALTDDYWQSLRDLFTRDVTHQGLRELLQHEAQETFRFLTREVEPRRPRAAPLVRAAPEAAVAVLPRRRLPPEPVAARVLFAGAVFVLALGWLGFSLDLASVGPFSLRPLARPAQPGSSVAATRPLLPARARAARQAHPQGRPRGRAPDPVRPPALRALRARRGRASCTAMRPANTVGGDYFDVIELGEGAARDRGRRRRGQGHARGAAHGPRCRAACARCSRRGFRGEELVTKLNAHLCANIPSNRLITLFYGELDPATGALRYVNAGHNPPFLLSAREPPGAARGHRDGPRHHDGDGLSRR